MNDFTKEELQEIYEIMMDYRGLVISCHREKMDMLLSGFISLTGKIQSMIDNYCEHETASHLCRMKIQNLCNKCNEYVDIIYDNQ